MSHRKRFAIGFGIEKQSISERSPHISICHWPEMESRLYGLFLDRREIGQAIRRSLFRIYARYIFNELYPNASQSIFWFSNWWFQRFLRRYRVSLRCIRIKAKMAPEDYRKPVINWHCFNRQNSQLLSQESALCNAAGHYYLSNICNLYETDCPSNTSMVVPTIQLLSKQFWLKKPEVVGIYGKLAWCFAYLLLGLIGSH